MNSIRVIKIGGSLLQRPGLLVDLQHWQATLVQPMVNVWIVGGGTAVDAIRDQDRNYGMADSTSHWASIKAMDANAVAFAGHLPGWQITDDPEEIFRTGIDSCNLSAGLQGSPEIPLPFGQAWFSDGVLHDQGTQSRVTQSRVTQNWVLKTHRWIKESDAELSNQHLLPHSWAVTSDSIAAWAAIQIRASRVILLKSCQVPTATVPELARLGIVDSYLPTLVNLQQHCVQFKCEHLHRHGESHHETIPPNN